MPPPPLPVVDAPVFEAVAAVNRQQTGQQQQKVAGDDGARSDGGADSNPDEQQDQQQAQGTQQHAQQQAQSKQQQAQQQQQEEAEKAEQRQAALQLEQQALKEQAKALKQHAQAQQQAAEQRQRAATADAQQATAASTTTTSNTEGEGGEEEEHLVGLSKASQATVSRSRRRGLMAGLTPGAAAAYHRFVSRHYIQRDGTGPAGGWVGGACGQRAGGGALRGAMCRMWAVWGDSQVWVAQRVAGWVLRGGQEDDDEVAGSDGLDTEGGDEAWRGGGGKAGASGGGPQRSDDSQIRADADAEADTVQQAGAEGREEEGGAAGRGKGEAAGRAEDAAAGHAEGGAEGGAAGKPEGREEGGAEGGTAGQAKRSAGSARRRYLQGVLYSPEPERVLPDYDSFLYHVMPGSMGTRENFLRPEVVESLFYLYRATGDPVYQEWGWNMFRAYELWSKMPGGGYTVMRDVDTVPPVPGNKMESFWLAETLKYFYLLFCEPDVIPLSQYVFNTEAHPLPIWGSEPDRQVLATLPAATRQRLKHTLDAYEKEMADAAAAAAAAAAGPGWGRRRGD